MTTYTTSDLARLTVHHCNTIVSSDEHGDIVDSLFQPTNQPNHQEMTP